VLFLATSGQVNNSELQLLCWKTKKPKCSPSSSTCTRNTSEVLLLHDNSKLHTSGHTTKAIIRNFEWTVLPHPPYNLDLAHQITIYFVLWKKAYEDTITPTIKHCIMPHARGCRGERVTFTRQEHTLLFKGGRRILPKMGTMLKNNYVFSKFVAKFCEFFTLFNL